MLTKVKPVPKAENKISLRKKKEKETRTNLKNLFRQCLNKRDQDLFPQDAGSSGQYSLKQMRENPRYLRISKMGLTPYLNKVIALGASLCPEGRVFVAQLLRSGDKITDAMRTKVSLYYKGYWEGSNF